MPSERPNHRLQEIWQPLGVVGCVTAFNFPVAVFGWNFCLAAVCGNSIIWKPSPHAEGCADLVKKIWDEVADEHKDLVLIKKGGNEAAIELAEDEGGDADWPWPEEDWTWPEQDGNEEHLKAFNGFCLICRG